MGILTCQMCGFETNIDSHINTMMAHLHDMHNIRKCDGSFEEYVYKYFERPKCACGQCDKLVSLHCRRIEFNTFADDCQNFQRFRNVSCPEYYLYRGISPDDTIKCISDRQSRVAQKSVTEEHIKKLSAINTGDSNPASIASIVKRTKKHETEIRNELSRKCSGENNGFYGRHHTEQTLSKLAKIRSNMARQISKPELIIWGMLHALGIDFEYQVQIGRYIVDFLVGDCVIEVYGDYWHGDKMKSSDKKSDIQKERFLKDNHNLLIIWESEISGSTKEIVNKLCELKK